jgi:hypothetical protein
MRCCLALLMLLSLGIAFSQVQAPAKNGFPAVRPDVIIYVKGHWTGANVVQISMVEANYPPEMLRKQVEDLCRRLDHPATGLAVTPYVLDNNPNLKFLQATFGTSGLNDEEGNANLTPLIQAFAGVPAPHTIKGMEIFYSEFDPPIKGPKSFTSPTLRIHGRQDRNPPQVEYAVELLSQNPSELLVETKPSAGEARPLVTPTQNSSPVLLWCLILMAGVAAGALVYFLLVKRLSGRSPSSV